MSRYGRIADADDLDRYYTPPAPVHVLLDSPEWPDPDRIAEPCAGQGHLADVLEDAGYFAWKTTRAADTSGIRTPIVSISTDNPEV